MKKIFLASVLSIALLSCGNSSDSSATTTDTVPNPNTASDKTHQPDGITNGSVTSTDTGAMNTDHTGVKKNTDTLKPK